MRKPNIQKSTKPRNTLRIIGGQWRGRKFAIANVDGLRPTGDRIRETLFNWLAPYVQDANCLDCFAGSGALGLECLSRGAQAAWLVENNSIASTTLARHLQQLNSLNGHLVKANCLEWLAQKPLTQHSINMAFIDPPFAENLWEKTILQLEDSDVLASDAMIYIETPSHIFVDVPSHWHPHRSKQSGQVNYQLFLRSATASTPTH